MSYIASKILMVRPASFGYNPQTAGSNAFQIEVDLSDEEIQSKALKEFNAMAEELQNLGIEVLVINDANRPYTPDAVFPNNWFSTHIDGTLCLYPMEANARRLERSPGIIKQIKENINLTRILDFSGYESENKFLEGTGSLVLDHKSKLAFASISSRTNKDILFYWMSAMDFDVFKFHSFDQSGKAIYHTNVMMCLGDEFAVVCLESITDETEKGNLIKTLHKTNREIVEISFEQMNNFAGNMLLLQNSVGKKFLVMSKTARNSLNKSQITRLEKYANLHSFDIGIIEKCGGGSVRCMIAELF